MNRHLSHKVPNYKDATYKVYPAIPIQTDNYKNAAREEERFCPRTASGDQGKHIHEDINN